MGVYIKDMEMPTNCMACPFKGFDRAGGRGNVCTINNSITLHAVLDGVDVKFVRMGECPLVPVPPHGRLIDADAYESLLRGLGDRNYRREKGTICGAIKFLHPHYAPTIIPAEEGE